MLVPAHDEATGLVASLASIQAQLASGDRLLVVADNCNDDTAALARAAGAETIERQDSLNRGKGYALDFGMRHLAAAPRQVLIVVDADCLLADGALGRLARACVIHARPVQALYLMLARSGAAPHTLVAEFAWRVKNWLRPLGAARLGMPCQLMGSGMAFPWSTICQATLASGHIVEDLKLGLDLAAAGQAPLFCPAALVTSMFPDNRDGSQAQRRRWEHGHLGMMLQDGPRLLWTSLRRRDRQLLLLTLDLCVPPLSLLILMLALVCGAAALGNYYGAAVPWPLLLAAPVLLSGALIAAWFRSGRQILPPARLWHVACYLLAKLPLYIGFLLRRQRIWVAARRDKS